jgi:hypothetical protein
VSQNTIPVTGTFTENGSHAIVRSAIFAPGANFSRNVVWRRSDNTVHELALNANPSSVIFADSTGEKLANLNTGKWELVQGPGTVFFGAIGNQMYAINGNNPPSSAEFRYQFASFSQSSWTSNPMLPSSIPVSLGYYPVRIRARIGGQVVGPTVHSYTNY